MTTLEKFQELANIEFVEYNPDIEIGTLLTADGYDIHYIGTDVQNLNFENEVYYYQPDFDTIMNTISVHRFNNKETITVACYDIEDYFDEYYMLDFIQDNMDEEAFDEFTNNTLQNNY